LAFSTLERSVLAVVGKNVPRAALLLSLLALTGVARAQDAGVDAAVDPAFQRAIDSDPWTGTGSEESTDPLGSADTATLAAVTDDPDVDEVEAPIPIRHGEILEAISGVSERSHAIAVTLEGGLAVVTETIVLGSSARHRAEAMLRLAAPAGAAIVSLHVENGLGARDGVVADASAPQSAYDDALLVRSTTPNARPVAHVRLDRDAWVVRAAPVSIDDGADGAGALTVRIAWVVPVPMHGGVARLSIPARGTDARVVHPSLTLSAVDLVEPRVDGSSYEHGAVEVRTDAPLVITALAPLSRGPRVDASLVPCASQHCVVLRASGGRARVSAAPITIAIDASPSTTIGARGRIADTVRVLSALLPASTRVRWIAFAGRTEELGRGVPADLDLARVRAAIDLPLGSATRFSALWAAIRGDAHAGDRILIVGDGGLTSGVLETAALEEARTRGVILSTLDVADRSPTIALASAVAGTGGVTVEAGAAADRAAGGHGDDLLTELVSQAIVDAVGAIDAQVDARPVSLGTLRTGESALWLGPAARADVAMGDARVTARTTDAAHAVVLSALAAHQSALIAVDAGDLDAVAGACNADGSPRARTTSRASSIVGHGLRIAPAHRRACASTVMAATTAARPASLPARVLRDQLRRRVIPPARQCFRDDRGGRPRLHREIAFDLVLADREIVDASIDGDIPDALRTCLLGAFDGIEVPSFDGTLRVRWPLHTEAILPPPVIELAPDVAREVRAIAGDSPLPTSPSP
jgi:hypothetical protein